MTALPWIFTCVFAAGTGFCLALFGAQLDETREELGQARDDLAAIKTWIDGRFGEQVDTAPMPAVSIRDARTAVAAAREANRERPTPFPRTEGRHRA